MRLDAQTKRADKMLWKIKKAIDAQTEKYKLIRVGTAKWTNEITKLEDKVDHIYILGFESSWKPMLITKAYVKDINGTNSYEINKYFVHTNVSSEVEEKELLLMIDNKATICTLYGQNFCNPLSADHVLTMPEEETRGLIKANLLSQNFDDAYTSIRYVTNNDDDVILDSGLTRQSSIIELMLNTPGYNFDYKKDEINEKVEKLKNMDNESIYAKRKDAECYAMTNKSHYRRFREQYSDYYPAFTKEYIQNLELEEITENFDIGVYGLGSAGSAILDQLTRSNYIKDIYLCDFDRVEYKNINNQWYTNEYIDNTKTESSRRIIRTRQREIGNTSVYYNVKSDCKKFQETNYKSKKFKYVVSGFDSIKVRQDFFNEIKKGNIKADFLIDCRYLDLAGSVYVIDTSDKKQMEFYEANLNEDAELLRKQKEKDIMTEEEFYEWLETTEYTSNCSTVKDHCFLNRPDCNNADCNCGNDACKKCFYEAYLKDGLDSPIKKQQTNTCIKQNYIDIYKYVGAIVFGAIRKIQQGATKPFTLLEAQTDVNGLPNYMIVKE